MASSPPRVARSTFFRRTAFRFCVVYFALYSVATQIAGGLLLLPGFAVPSLGTRWPMRAVTEWLAVHLFGITTPLAVAGNSGDTTFHWIQTGWLLILSAVAGGAWAALDNDEEGDAAIARWLRLLARFALASQMFYFGMAKVIPAQFPPPSLVTLIQPVGHLSRTDLLWTFVGASTGYQIFTGAAEVLAGLLLVVPQTAALGAAVACADLIQVLALNMAYDVGLKQITVHLILLSLFVLAPAVRPVADVMTGRRSASRFTEPPLFITPAANRRAWLAQVAFGLYLLAMFTRLASIFWQGPGGPGSARSELYGIWDVEQLSVDGELRSPALNDYDRRWRRLIFDATETLVMQRTDDSLAHYGATVDARGGSIALRKRNSRSWKATLAFVRPRPDRLTLDGAIDGHVIHAELQRLELDTFQLLNSGFRWIRPPD
jgi:hypothetical protein